MDEGINESDGKASSPMASDSKQPKRAAELNFNTETVIDNLEDMIDRDFMVKAKIGDGLCIASLILGIMVTIITPYIMVAGNNDIYDASGLMLLVAVPISICAMVTGLLGTRLQRMVNYKFGFGVAGAVLGFIIFLMLMIYALMFTFLGEISW